LLGQPSASRLSRPSCGSSGRWPRTSTPTLSVSDCATTRSAIRRWRSPCRSRCPSHPSPWQPASGTPQPATTDRRPYSPCSERQPASWLPSATY
jgi:hypothetical protein